MKISLTDTSSFVLRLRNKENSVFYIRPKSDFEKEINSNTLVISIENENIKEESEIIEMIKTGIKFYTYFDNTFTVVTIVNGHLKSFKNKTKEDNIEKLPIIG